MLNDRVQFGITDRQSYGDPQMSDQDIDRELKSESRNFSQLDLRKSKTVCVNKTPQI